MPFSPPYSASALLPGFDQFYGETTGQTFQDNRLLRKNLLNVFYAGQLLIAEGETNAEWSFNATTGTVTFVNTITSGLSLLLQFADY